MREKPSLRLTGVKKGKVFEGKMRKFSEEIC